MSYEELIKALVSGIWCNAQAQSCIRFSMGIVLGHAPPEGVSPGSPTTNPLDSMAHSLRLLEGKNMDGKYQARRFLCSG